MTIVDVALAGVSVAGQLVGTFQLRPYVFGFLAFFLVAGLTRAQLGWQQSGASRYVYVAALLWLILLAEVARSMPWRGTWRPALAALAFLACFNSAVVLVDPASVPFLAGSEVDFVDDLIGAAFRINNPKAKASCGCGTSFSL